jgi:hypothetical protein
MDSGLDFLARLEIFTYSYDAASCPDEAGRPHPSSDGVKGCLKLHP